MTFEAVVHLENMFVLSPMKPTECRSAILLCCDNFYALRECCRAVNRRLSDSYRTGTGGRMKTVPLSMKTSHKIRT